MDRMSRLKEPLPLGHVDELHELDVLWLDYSEHGPIILDRSEYNGLRLAAEHFFAHGMDYGKRLMDRTAQIDELNEEIRRLTAGCEDMAARLVKANADSEDLVESLGAGRPAQCRS